MSKPLRNGACEDCGEHVDELKDCPVRHRPLCWGCLDLHAWKHEDAADASLAPEAPV